MGVRPFSRGTNSLLRICSLKCPFFGPPKVANVDVQAACPLTLENPSCLATFKHVQFITWRAIQLPYGFQAASPLQLRGKSTAVLRSLPFEPHSFPTFDWPGAESRYREGRNRRFWLTLAVLLLAALVGCFIHDLTIGVPSVPGVSMTL